MEKKISIPRAIRIDVKFRLLLGSEGKRTISSSKWFHSGGGEEGLLSQAVNAIVGALAASRRSAWNNISNVVSPAIQHSLPILWNAIFTDL